MLVASPQLGQSNCLHMLPNVPWGAKIAPGGKPLGKASYWKPKRERCRWIAIQLDKPLVERDSQTTAIQKHQNNKYSNSIIVFPSDLLPVVPLDKSSWKPEGTNAYSVIQKGQPLVVDNGGEKGGEIWGSKWKVPNLRPYRYHGTHACILPFSVLRKAYHHLMCCIISSFVHCLIHRRCSINVFQMNEYMNE